MEKEVKVYKFENGATLIYNPVNSKFTSFSVGYRINNKKSKPGLAHLVEHIMGSDQDEKIEQKNNKYEVSNNVITNATTSFNNLSFECDCLNDKIEKQFKITSERVFNRNINNKVVEREKKIVVQEYRDYYTPYDDSTSTEVFIGNISEHIGASNNSNYFDILLGNNNTIRKYNTNTVLNFVRQNFRPDNMIMAISTSLPFEKVKELYEKYFVNNSKNIDESSQLSEDEEIQEDSLLPINNLLYQEHDSKLKTVSIDIVYPTIDNPIMNSCFSILNNFIMNGLNGRLCQKLRGEGLVYSAYITNQFLNDKSLISMISTSTSKKNVNKVIDYIGEIIKDLVENGITLEEFKNFKEHLKVYKARLAEVEYIDNPLILIDLYNKNLLDVKNIDKIRFNKTLTRKDIHNHFINLFENNNIFVNISGDYAINNTYGLREIENKLGAKTSKAVYHSGVGLYIKPNEEEFYNTNFQELNQQQLMKLVHQGRVGIMTSDRIKSSLEASANQIVKELENNLKKQQFANSDNKNTKQSQNEIANNQQINDNFDNDSNEK